MSPMPNSYDYPIPLDPQTMQPMQQGSTGYAPPSMPSGYANLLGNRDLALALLANSGRSPYKRGFGEILGTSMLQADQAKQGREDEAFKRQYMMAQMQALQRGQAERSPYGQYQPGDYTPKSWAAFLKGGDPSVLERYTTPRQEYTPSFKNVTRTLPDGSTELGSFDTRTNEYTWSGQIVPAGTKARVDAEGKALGEATGGQSGKAPAKASMDYVISQFEPMLDQTMQGGPFGIIGKSGSLFDYSDKKRFDNLREQLSTELRTVFRIPGEGTLSDREQAQYGLQLPSTDNPGDVNRAILRDVRERVRLRLETPVSGGQAPAASPAAPARQPTLDEIRAKYGR